MRETMMTLGLWVILGTAQTGCGNGGEGRDASGDSGDATDAPGEEVADSADTPESGEDLAVDTDADEEPAPSWCGPLVPTDRSGEGPAGLLDEPAFVSRPPDLGIDRSSVSATTVEYEGRTFHVIRFDVTTFTDRFNRDWVSSVTIVAPQPEELAAADAAAFLAQLGTSNPQSPGEDDPTWGSAPPAWFAGTDTEMNFSRSYSSIVYSYGVPLVIGMPVPSAIELDTEIVAAIQAEAAMNDDPCDDSLCGGELTDEGVISDCLRRAVTALGDLTQDPYLHYAVAEMRIVDAAQDVLNGVYAGLGSGVAVDWARLWTIGSSKRGNAQRLAAAIDDRIDGVVVSAANISNFEVFFNAQLSLWEGAYSFDAPTAVDELGTAFGRSYLEAYDSFLWDPEVLDGVAYVMAVGTNDPAYPIMSSLFYMESLPAERRFVMVPNYGHGMGAVDHLAALRALVDLRLNGAAWPTVEAQWDWLTNRVTATVGGPAPDAVDLWCTTSNGENPAVIDTLPDCSRVPMTPEDGTDLRHAIWTRQPMTGAGGGVFEIDVPPSALSYPACVVRVVADGDKVSTSVPLLSEPLCSAAGLPMQP
jgi:hypothetical protein